MSTAIAGILAPQLIDARGFRLRHIAPTATWPSEGATATVLGKTYGFTELPMSHTPTSPDLVEGNYTGRLGDSGEFSVSFPNVAGSKGLWRERFSADRSLEFIEVYRDDNLEFVSSIQRIEIDRGTVTVSGTDAWALLRRAYEQDRAWTAAPQEVGIAYTRVPVALVADDFDGSSLAGAWTVTGTLDSVASSRVRVKRASAGSLGITRTIATTSDTWRVLARISGFTSVGGVSEIDLNLVNGSDVVGSILISQSLALNQFQTNVAASYSQAVRRANQIAPPDQVPVTLEIIRQGRWLRAFVNGALIGYLPYRGTAPTSLSVGGAVYGTSGSVDIDSVLFEEQLPFLARGSDLGDYVLPGDQPTGGLRGRYYDNHDLEALSADSRAAQIMAPNRDPSGERLDAVLDTGGGLVMPMTGDGNYFSIRWFGSVYLRGDIGNYVFETNQADGARVWVGDTRWGSQLIDDWVVGAGRLTTGTWTAANFGSGAGWYPIVVEHKHDTTAYGFILKFTPPGTGYTDPGGTSIVASTKIVIPKTSLSPLGCYDNRVQGTSHFDLVQGAAAQFGYQLWCEPMQLESGEFPGRLVPRIRVGRDTDVVLETEDTDGVEPALSPGLTLDGSDQAVVLIGSGAGLADGKGSQVSAEVYDTAGMSSALFSLQATVDAADIAFPDLLAARLSAELALRGTPWEEVRATPRAQERLSDTWPLSSVLSAMRWRPGDGIRLSVPSIGVIDTAPRQMLQVTRSFAAEGRTGTQVAFRQRPRSAARSVRGSLRAAISSQRSYQGSVVPLQSNYLSETTPAGGIGAYAIVPLFPGDKVVKATLRIPINVAAQTLDVELNGTLRGSALGGPWSGAPVEVDVTGYATQVSPTDSRLYMRIKNTGGSSTALEAQLFVEVLR